MVARLVERARERSRDVQARAAAVAELAAADAVGALDPARIEARLAALKSVERARLNE